MESIRFGELLVEEGIINDEQLQEALDLQKDNPKIPIGEILLSLGYIDREQLLGYMESQIFLTGKIPEDALEMLDQSEVDAIWKNFKDSNNK